MRLANLRLFLSHDSLLYFFVADVEQLLFESVMDRLQRNVPLRERLCFRLVGLARQFLFFLQHELFAALVLSTVGQIDHFGEHCLHLSLFALPLLVNPRKALFFLGGGDAAALFLLCPTSSLLLDPLFLYHATHPVRHADLQRLETVLLRVGVP